jgi:hypothetical protein
VDAAVDLEVGVGGAEGGSDEGWAACGEKESISVVRRE